MTMERRAAPRWVWRLMTGVVIGRLALLVWGTLDPARVVVVEAEVSAPGEDLPAELTREELEMVRALTEYADPDAELEPTLDIPPEDPFAHAYDPTAAEDSGAPPGGRPAPRALEVEASPGPLHEVEDPDARMAAVREIIRRHTEEEEAAWAEEDARVDRELEELALDLEAFDVVEDEWDRPASTTAPPPTWAQSVRWQGRSALGLLLALLLVFVGRREGEPLYVAAGLVFGFDAGLGTTAFLFEGPWVTTFFGAMADVPVVAFGLLALTARRYVLPLALFMFGADLLVSPPLWGSVASPSIAEALFFATSAFWWLRWALVVVLFAPRAWPPSASGDPASAPTLGGPYREASPGAELAPPRRLVPTALRIVGIWIGVQVLIVGLQALPRDFIFRADGWVVAADVAAAILLTLEARGADSETRSALTASATLLWLLTLSHALLRSVGRAIDFLPQLVIYGLGAVGAGLAVGLLLGHLERDARARLGRRLVRPLELVGAFFGAVVLRGLIASPTAAPVVCFVPALCVLVAVAGVFFFRLTRAHAAAEDDGEGARGRKAQRAASDEEE